MRLNQLLGSVADAGRDLLSKRGGTTSEKTLKNYCSDLLTSKGEALGTAIATEVVNAYKKADIEQKVAFFRHLLDHYSPDPDTVADLAGQYQAKKDFETYVALNEAIEAPRQMLFRRINMANQGTETLVQLRSDLLRAIKDDPSLKPIDFDLQHLLKSWFNRGFLTLQEVSWNTSAQVLEKLIKYEAVHSMAGWDDLKKRVGKNRRCFAFFHPSLPDEPLIFVEVALVRGLADKVQPLINPDYSDEKESDADTAIFYSISNCQSGLAGISFGNFLIKQVVMELKRELPSLTQFSTLSPIPGFIRWLNQEMPRSEDTVLSDNDREIMSILENKNWYQDTETLEAIRPRLMRLCGHYLLQAKKGKSPLDPVSRFHLGNGARVERLNWMGDTSANGLRQSAGILVNYYYDISQVEKNHELFVNDGTIAVSKAFMKEIN